LAARSESERLPGASRNASSSSNARSSESTPRLRRVSIASVALQKVERQALELARLLDLRPVSAFREHMSRASFSRFSSATPPSIGEKRSSSPQTSSVRHATLSSSAPSSSLAGGFFDHSATVSGSFAAAKRWASRSSVRNEAS
jgi:hypothetical protein